MLGIMEDQARKNMQLFVKAMAAFTPFPASGAEDKSAESSPAKAQESGTASSGSTEIERIRLQLAAMQSQLDALATRNDKPASPAGEGDKG
jgi:polyhydroxyalkanoate synthesis regulator protein